MEDQNAGMGGSYVLDPKTGERTLIQRTDEITDFALLPREYLIPDDSAIGKVVRALGNRTNIPGVRVYAETIISSRSA